MGKSEARHFIQGSVDSLKEEAAIISSPEYLILVAAIMDDPKSNAAMHAAYKKYEAVGDAAEERAWRLGREVSEVLKAKYPNLPEKDLHEKIGRLLRVMHIHYNLEYHFASPR